MNSDKKTGSSEKKEQSMRFDPREFVQRPRAIRLALLGLATMVLVFRLGLFFTGHINPTLQKFLAIDPRDQVYNLIYFGWFAWILLSVLVVMVIVGLTGRPQKENGMFQWLPYRHISAPIIAPLLFWPLTYLAVTQFPIAMFLQGIDLSGINFIKARPLFLREAIVVATAMAISVADAQIDTRYRPWWTLPFLIVPLPILWWNTVVRWMPSRYWSFWRPVLTLLTFGPMLLQFLSGPSEFKDLAAIEKQPLQAIVHHSLDDCIGYQIAPSPIDDSIYINCDSRLARYRYNGNQWQRTGLFDPHGFWDEGAFDFSKDTAYLFIGLDRRLEVIDLTKLTSRETAPYSKTDFSPETTGIHQAIDVKSGLLFVAENFGEVVSIAEDSLQIRNHTAVTTAPDVQIWRILQGKPGELYILQNHTLLVFHDNDLKLLRKVTFKDAAYDMYYDRTDSRIYVSFPAAMEVRVYDSETLQRTDRIPAPSAVRPVAIDHKRGWIVMGSYGGALSIRDLYTHRLIKRIRFIPWQRRIELFPERGQLLLTASKFDAIDLDYANLDAPFDFADSVLLWTERLYRLSARKVDETITLKP